VQSRAMIGSLKFFSESAQLCSDILSTHRARATQCYGIEIAVMIQLKFSVPFVKAARRQHEARHLLPFQTEACDAELSSTLQDDLSASIEETEKRAHPKSASMFDIVRHGVFMLGSALVPSPLNRYFSIGEPKSTKPETAYLDGLRGIAAFIVYIDHFSAPHLSGMLDSYGSSPSSNSLLQLPIIRLLYAGSPMVCVFFVISGTVLSLKPVALIRAQRWEAMSQNLASYVFRRAIRLFLPTTFATFLIMLMVQMRFYTAIYPLPENPDFIRSHPTSLSFFGQFQDWITYILTRLYYPDLWFQPHASRTEADYAPQLWTIEVEFYSSMVLFTTLTGLSRTHASIRHAAVAVLLAFCLYIGRWDISLFLSGILICASILSSSPNSLPLLQNPLGEACDDSRQATGQAPRFPRFLTQASWVLTLIFALIITSYTSNHGTSPLYLPLRSISHSRWTWEATGSALLVLSITKIPILQRLLECGVPQYLGRISYALYVVHFPILSAGAWSLLPWVWGLLGKEGWRFGLGYMLTFALLTPAVLWVADLWSRGVDESCVRFGRWLEAKVAVAEGSA
jgi:peptidoglycan/LPS O-acetylase OafA/YrhL